MRRGGFRKKFFLYKWIQKGMKGIGSLFVYRSPEKRIITDPQLEEIYRGKSKKELAKMAGCSHTNSKSWMIRRILNS